MLRYCKRLSTVLADLFHFKTFWIEFSSMIKSRSEKRKNIENTPDGTDRNLIMVQILVLLVHTEKFLI